jgi:hypothetical protein
MATGIQTASPRLKTVRLVESATAANGAPTGAPSSTPAATVGFLLSSETLIGPDCTVRLYSTAGSGVMTLSYARVWGYSTASTAWVPLGVGTDADKGKLNNGAAFGETAADVIAHAEPLYDITHFDGVYVELGVFGGTATAISVDLDFPINR